MGRAILEDLGDTIRQLTNENLLIICHQILTLTDGPWLAGSSIKEERPELQESRCQRWNKTMLLGWNLKVFVRRLTRSLGHTGSHSQRASDVMGTWNNMKSLDRNLKVEQHIGGSRKVDGVG